MHATVDEKPQSTLDKRLGEPFKQVSDRLEAVTWGIRIGELARRQRPGGLLIEHGDDFAQALTNTGAAMADEGDVLLFEPAFSAPGGAVRCDILERRQGQWTLTEVKGAGGAKDHHLLDVTVVALGERSSRAHPVSLPSPTIPFTRRPFVTLHAWAS